MAYIVMAMLSPRSICCACEDMRMGRCTDMFGTTVQRYALRKQTTCMHEVAAEVHGHNYIGHKCTDRQR